MTTAGLPRARLSVMIALCISLAGCTAPSLQPETPKVVSALAIAPFEQHEECVPLAEGDRLDYHFEAKAPVTFHIRYIDDRIVVIPVSREEVLEGSGVFRSRLQRDYCLRWEAGRQGALLDYRIRLLPGKS